MGCVHQTERYKEVRGRTGFGARAWEGGFPCRVLHTPPLPCASTEGVFRAMTCHEKSACPRGGGYTGHIFETNCCQKGFQSFAGTAFYGLVDISSFFSLICADAFVVVYPSGPVVSPTERPPKARDFLLPISSLFLTRTQYQELFRWGT